MAVTQELVDNIKKQLEGLSQEEQQKKFQEILATLPPEDQKALTSSGECPFCSMVAGNIPIKKVYEDGEVMAVLDINPANKGHVILFPKKHYQFLPQMEDNDVAHLFKVATRLCDAVFQVLEAQGTNIVVSNGPAAGQTSPHVLVNIIPRFEKDEVNIGWNSKKLEDAEMDEVASKISEKAKEIKINKQETVVIKQEAEEIKKEDFRKDIPIP